MNNIVVKVKKLSDDAILPVYATEGAACFDIYSPDSGIVPAKDSKSFRTGLSFEIPVNHVMLVFSRSGHGFKNGIRLSNCVGVIDSDYRGELGVKLTNDSTQDYFVEKNSRIAQAMVIPYDYVTFVEVDELSETKRGTGGLGSTGVK